MEFGGTERFQLVRRLGAGGMGVVYEAIDRDHETRVALKTLRTWTADSFLRFKAEFRALQDLHHPNLVSLGELLEEHGTWFFTMELVEGAPFLSWVCSRSVVEPIGGEVDLSEGVTAGEPTVGSGNAPTGDMPPGTLARLAAASSSMPPWPVAHEGRLRAALAQLAQGLCVLHRAHKVHRDIKPANVLITRDGQVKILDFGLVIDPSRQPWPEDELVGTAAYMAPEQATTQRVGPEADWYSVGVVLYQALTGRLPFYGPLERLIELKQAGEPPAPHVLCPSVPVDLDELCVDLLRVEPGRRPCGAEVLRRLHVDDRASLASAPPEHFVGRRRELVVLDDGFAASRQVTVTLLVHGESGVGKSALVDRFVERLRRANEAVVCAGRCHERESVPYKAVDGVIDAISRRLTALPAAAAAAVLPDEIGLLGQMFPVMKRLEAVAKAPARDLEAVDPQELRRRVFAILRELLARLARREPLVLVIDDLQWADADSLALLAEVLHPPDAPPLLLLATLRPTLDGEAGARSVRELAARLPGDVRLLAIESLPPADALALVELLAGDAVAGAGGPDGPDGAHAIDREAIAREAGGHPLFIQELIRGGATPGQARPIRLEDALWSRVARLDHGARDLLELIALAGAPVAHETAARALGIELGGFLHQVTRLRADHLVKTSGPRRTDAVEPYHDRVRSAVLVNLDEPSRRRGHQRLATALEVSHHIDPEALATHWRGAGDAQRAAIYAARAAEDAAEALAFDRAARLYRLALELRAGPGSTPTALDRMEAMRLSARLGDALTNAGRGAEAAAAYLAAASSAGAADALDLRRRAAEQLLRSGHIDAGLEAVRSVLAAVGMKLPRSPRTALVSLLACRARVRLHGLGYVKREEAAVPADQLLRIDACWAVGAGLALVDNVRGSCFQARGLLYALAAGEPFRIARALAAEACFSSSAGGPSHRRTHRLLAASERLAHEVGHPYVLAWAASAAGVTAALEGRWPTALERCEVSEALFRDHCVGVAWELAIMRWFSLWSLAYRGDLAELARRVPLRIADAAGRGDLHAEIGHSTGLANLVWLASDDAEQARRRGDDAMARWSHKTFHVEHWWNLLGQTQVDLYRGDGAEAYARVTRGWPDLKRSLLLMVQLTRLEATHLRARAAIQAARAAGGDRDRLLAAAQRDARRIAHEHMPWSTPLARLIEAGVAAARDDQARAHALLAGAVPGLEAAGMALYAVAARRCQGRLEGGDAGSVLVAEAEAWLRRQGVTEPARMVDMLVPGFAD